MIESLSTMKATTVTDVTVVGGGPVGMTAALALAARGLTVALIERRAGTSNEPKAISLDDESLRLYQAAQVIDQIMPIIVPGTGTRYYGNDGAELFHARASVPFRLGYPFKNPFAQPDLERVLFEAIEAHPLITTYYGHELHSFEQNTSDGVRVTAQGTAGTQTVHSQYLIGADGGRSTVRRLLGIGMTGRSFNEAWLVVDTIDDVRTERYGMHHGESERPHVVIPGLNGRCRYEWRLFDGEANTEEPPPFELIERLVSRYRPITPEQVERAVCYKFHGLIADTWRQHNVFLAGDAAHMMPPFAGQGLNSGIRDVGNLAWKITEAVKSSRGEHFLDSYEAERRPHAEAVVESSIMLGRIVMTTDSRVAEWRDQKVRTALTTAGGRTFFEEMQYRPVNRYTEGLVGNSQSPMQGLQIGQPTVFDFSTRSQLPLDQLLGNGWAVVGVQVSAPEILRESQHVQALNPRCVSVPLDDLIDPEGELVRMAIDLDTRLYSEFSAERGRIVLIRPDRFIAHSWSPGEGADVAGLIETWLK